MPPRSPETPDGAYRAQTGRQRVLHERHERALLGVGLGHAGTGNQMGDEGVGIGVGGVLGARWAAPTSARNPIPPRRGRLGGGGGGRWGAFRRTTGHKQLPHRVGGLGKRFVVLKLAAQVQHSLKSLNLRQQPMGRKSSSALKLRGITVVC